MSSRRSKYGPSGTCKRTATANCKISNSCLRPARFDGLLELVFGAHKSSTALQINISIRPHLQPGRPGAWYPSSASRGCREDDDVDRRLQDHRGVMGSNGHDGVLDERGLWPRFNAIFFIGLSPVVRGPLGADMLLSVFRIERQWLAAVQCVRLFASIAVCGQGRVFVDSRTRRRRAPASGPALQSLSSSRWGRGPSRTGSASHEAMSHCCGAQGRTKRVSQQRVNRRKARAHLRKPSGRPAPAVHVPGVSLSYGPGSRHRVT